MPRWKELFLELIKRAAHGLQRVFERCKRVVKRLFGWVSPAHILPYRGFGTQRQFHLTGRVLEYKGIRTPQPKDSLWRNARAMYRRFATDEIPGARVHASCYGHVQEALTDDEGYFEFSFRPPPFKDDQLWHTVRLWLDQAHTGSIEATGYVLTPSSDSSFAVISDIDDTVIHSHATDFLKLAWITFSNNASTRVALPGVAAFYRALHGGPDGQRRNPFFYVSSSAWNLYDMLAEVLDRHELPRGPILLRDMRSRPNTVLQTSHGHKLEKCERLLAAFPELPFILIGDAGQDDPLIYEQVVKDHPDRILAIYIREVGWRSAYEHVEQMAERVRQLGVDMLLVKETKAAALHAIERGLIAADSLPDITEERDADLRQ